MPYGANCDDALCHIDIIKHPPLSDTKFPHRQFLLPRRPEARKQLAIAVFSGWLLLELLIDLIEDLGSFELAYPREVVHDTFGIQNGDQRLPRDRSNA